MGAVKRPDKIGGTRNRVVGAAVCAMKTSAHPECHGKRRRSKAQIKNTPPQTGQIIAKGGPRRGLRSVYQGEVIVKGIERIAGKKSAYFKVIPGGGRLDMCVNAVFIGKDAEGRVKAAKDNVLRIPVGVAV